MIDTNELTTRDWVAILKFLDADGSLSEKGKSELETLTKLKLD